MICPKCQKAVVETGDDFCRHCGFSLAAPTPAPEMAAGVSEAQFAAMVATDSDGGEGLEIFGIAIFIVAWFFATFIAVSMGLPDFGASVLPWLSGALMLVGLVMLFMGFELRKSPSSSR
jgi:hypothetical protein